MADDFRFSKRSPYLIGVIGAQLVLAYEWGSAGWEKISGGKFVASLAGTFAHFASQNPYSWYKNFLLGFATNHASLFAYAVEWSEFLAGVTLAVTALICVYAKSRKLTRPATLIAAAFLCGGALMNANFYLAAGWTSPSTAGMNALMFWLELVLLYVWLASLRRPH